MINYSTKEVADCITPDCIRLRYDNSDTPTVSEVVFTLCLTEDGEITDIEEDLSDRLFTAYAGIDEFCKEAEIDKSSITHLTDNELSNAFDEFKRKNNVFNHVSEDLAVGINAWLDENINGIAKIPLTLTIYSSHSRTPAEFHLKESLFSGHEWRALQEVCKKCDIHSFLTNTRTGEVIDEF